jgi:hypothetical protein
MLMAVLVPGIVLGGALDTVGDCDSVVDVLCEEDDEAASFWRSGYFIWHLTKASLTVYPSTHLVSLGRRASSVLLPRNREGVFAGISLEVPVAFG